MNGSGVVTPGFASEVHSRRCVVGLIVQRLIAIGVVVLIAAAMGARLPFRAPAAATADGDGAP